MAESTHEFVSDQLAGLVALLTFGLTGLVAVLGGGTLVPVIAILGWFILTPLLFFYGETVADLVVGPPADDDGDVSEDPVETLKRRYAEGKIDEAEFERRLDDLVALDEGDAADGVSLSETDGRGRPADRDTGNVLERE